MPHLFHFYHFLYISHCSDLRVCWVKPLTLCFRVRHSLKMPTSQLLVHLYILTEIGLSSLAEVMTLIPHMWVISLLYQPNEFHCSAYYSCMCRLITAVASRLDSRLYVHFLPCTGLVLVVWNRNRVLLWLILLEKFQLGLLNCWPTIYQINCTSGWFRAICI